ncbi:MAG: hypothetical protein ACRDP6_21995 [Actinoallomurus sp.]
MDLSDRLGTLRFLIHDRDPLFTAAFGEVSKSEGMRIITTLPQTPRMNAIWHGCSVSTWSITTLPDRTRSRCQRPPNLETLPTRDAADLTDLRTLRRRPVVAGVISEYHHAA